MRLVIIACEVMHREIAHCVSRSKNIVDMRFQQKGLHDIGQKEMSQTLQQQINEVPKGEYEAILVGYGLCSNGIRGLTTEETPLVVPRAHDCITLLLGSKERYRECFDKDPGTYFRSTGWIERSSAEIGEDGKPKSVMTQLGLNATYEELVAKFGEDNAQYVMETLEGWGGTKDYDRLAYIDMDIGDFTLHEQKAREEAKEKGWRFDGLQGDIGLLQRLVDGKWDSSEFIIVKPGQQIAPTYGLDIVRAENR